MTQECVRITLVGGLGNQLFELFAGVNLAMTLKCKLEVNVSMLRMFGESHSNSIEEIDFNKLAATFDFIEKKESEFLYRLQGKISRTIPSHQVGVSRITKRYFSPVVGFDPNLLNLIPPINVTGYFQSWRNFKEVTEKFGENIELSVRQPSDWYAKMTKDADIKKPIMLHLRRGDYQTLKNSFGLLSNDYYLTALKRLGSEFDTREVWIFSDSPSEAQQLQKQLSMRATRVVSVPPGSRDLESLKLLSLGSAIIAANSTFSWWGAMLSNDNCLRIIPEQWFKSLPEPTDLIPQDWIRVKSLWKD